MMSSLMIWLALAQQTLSSPCSRLYLLMYGFPGCHCMPGLRSTLATIQEAVQRRLRVAAETKNKAVESITHKVVV